MMKFFQNTGACCKTRLVLHRLLQFFALVAAKLRFSAVAVAKVQFCGSLIGNIRLKPAAEACSRKRTPLARNRRNSAIGDNFRGMYKKWRRITAFGLFLFCGAALWAISDQELLARVDSLVSYFDTDFSAEYTIVQDRPGQSLSKTVAGVFRRDKQETYVIVIMEPVISKGQGYLKQGKTLWFYDPKSRRFNTTSSSERFQNTNARNSDFTRSTLAQDYKVVAGENGTLGQFKCRILRLEAVTTEVTYPKMKVWISEDGLLRKSEDSSLSGQLLRTSAIPDYHKIGSRYVPKQLLFVDELRGAVINGKFQNEKTQITITRPNFDKVADSVFSKTFLESVNR